MTSRAEAFELLGIPLESDQRTVTRAYRRLARATHPDVSPDPAAADRFAAVSAAFAIASMPTAPTETVVASSPGLSQATTSRIDVTVRQDRLADGIGAAPLPPSRLRPTPAIIAGPVIVRPSRRSTRNPG